MSAVPIIIIGVQRRAELGDLVLPAMALYPELAELTEQLIAGGFEIYDMSTRPEMGDALDAITAETPLVVAVHLWGIDVHGHDERLLRGYYYNRENHRLLPLTRELGVPLLALGDQPVNSMNYVTLYNKGRENPGEKPKLNKDEWIVVKAGGSNESRAPFAEFIRQHHYTGTSGGPAANYVFGLVHKDAPDELRGACWWRMPVGQGGNVVAQAYDIPRKSVLDLSRVAIDDSVPTNAATYMVASAIREIKRDGRFLGLVSFADDFRKHTGLIYRAGNWDYLGRGKSERVWADPTTGDPADPMTWTQVAKKQDTRTYRVEEMEARGLVTIGWSRKYRYGMYIGPGKGRRKPRLS